MSGPAQPHIPVMLREVLAAAHLQPGERAIDATFGRGGYTRALLASAEGVRVLALDRDGEAIAVGRVLQAQEPRLHLHHGPFSTLQQAADEAGFAPVDAVIFDLGVSSPQLDDATRGFSFRQDGPLDMRMGQDGPTAADLVNTLPAQPLADLIYRYGEEKRSRAVAGAIVAARAEARIERTGQLAEIVRRVVRSSGDGIDPATRTFQALRIAVNNELQELEQALLAAENVLAPGGRLVAVSFHSLEDRIVKQFMTARSGRGAQPSRHLPRLGVEAAPSFRLPATKPVLPAYDETSTNSRARSARLRLAIRTDAPAWRTAA